MKKKELKKEEPAVNGTASTDAAMKKLSKEMKDVEDKIEVLETEKTRLETELSNPEIYESGKQLTDIQTKLKSFTQQLEAENSRWDKLVNEIDALEQPKD